MPSYKNPAAAAKKSPASPTVNWGKYRLPWGHSETLGACLLKLQVSASEWVECITEGGGSRMLLQIQKDVKPQRSTNRSGALAVKRTCTLKWIAYTCIAYYTEESVIMSLVFFLQSSGVEVEVNDGAIFKIKLLILPQTH